MAVIKILSDKQESLLRTCRNMLERCSQNTTETAKVPRFAELVTEMAQLVADIDAAMVAKQTSRNTTKVTEQKNQYVANLVVTLDELSRLAETIGIEKIMKYGVIMLKKALKEVPKAYPMRLW